MAKIPVEKEQQSAWIWWLLGLLLLGGIIWFLVEAFDDEEDPDFVDVEEVEPTPTPQTQEYEGVDLGTILANPGEYVGEPFPTMEVMVSSVPTDRGFWISDNGDRLFVIIIDEPVDRQKDINPEQTLNIEGGTLHDSSYLSEVQGSTLGASTEAIAEEQSIFLVVDERHITIREAGVPQPDTDPAQNGQ